VELSHYRYNANFPALVIRQAAAFWRERLQLVQQPVTDRNRKLVAEVQTTANKGSSLQQLSDASVPSRLKETRPTNGSNVANHSELTDYLNVKANDSR